MTKQDAPLVRLAELEIDPVRTEAYAASLCEEIEASIEREPGVLMLYALTEKEHPARFRIIEVYADQNAYQAHLRTPHFLKYKSETSTMVKSLRLIETDPLLLRVKRMARGGDE